MRLDAATRRGAQAPALPVPSSALSNFGVRFRRGQLSLTVAAPGVGKSQLWQNIAHRTGSPTLYWSADTDAHDVLTRALALWTGSAVDEIDDQRDDPAWAGYFEQAMQQHHHVEWVFDPDIQGPVLVERKDAFAELRGEFPHLIVVDNLSNTVEDASDERSEQTTVMKVLQKLARDSFAHVAVLAHVKGQYEDGDRPIPLSGALNNLFKLPEVGLTLHRSSPRGDEIGVNVVKNRGGKADPKAELPIHFEVDYSRATVKGIG